MDKKAYVIKEDAWVYGKFYAKGARIELSEKQAKYELLSGTIAPYAPLSEPSAPLSDAE